MKRDGDFDRRWLNVHIAKRDWRFHRQLYRRCGIVLGIGQYTKIMKDIRAGRAALIKTKGEDRGVYAVRIKGSGKPVYVYAVDAFPRAVWIEWQEEGSL